MDRPNGPSGASQAGATTRLLVVGRIGGARYAWPAACVDRVLPMAAVTRVAGLPAGAVGVVDLHGDTLVVVDPRPRLGLPPQAARPEQHLLLVRATARFLLWVDCVETIVPIDSNTFAELAADEDGHSTPAFVTRVDGELVSVLSAAAFDPGPIVRAADEAR